MLGVLADSGAVILGSTIGILFKKAIPDRIFDMLLQAMGLCILVMGVSGALGGQNSLVLIISMAAGTLVGAFLDLDRHFNSGVEKASAKLRSIKIFSNKASGTGDRTGGGTDAFITSTLMFCVGAMAIVGSLNAGLLGDNSVLYTKTVIDLIGSVIFTATLGAGVYFSAVSLLVYEGAIVLLASYIKPFLTDFMMSEITCVGSVLIIVMGLNSLKLTDIKVLNMLPAILVPVLLCSMEFFAA